MKKFILGFLILLLHDVFLLALFSNENNIKFFVFGMLWFCTGAVLLGNIAISKDKLTKIIDDLEKE